MTVLAYHDNEALKEKFVAEMKWLESGDCEQPDSEKPAGWIRRLC